MRLGYGCRRTYRLNASFLNGHHQIKGVERFVFDYKDAEDFRRAEHVGRDW